MSARPCLRVGQLSFKPLLVRLQIHDDVLGAAHAALRFLHVAELSLLVEEPLIICREDVIEFCSWHLGVSEVVESAVRSLPVFHTALGPLLHLVLADHLIDQCCNSRRGASGLNLRVFPDLRKVVLNWLQRKIPQACKDGS